MPKRISAQARQEQALASLAGSAAAALLVAVFCFFPLYVDTFSNLGLTKFTGAFGLLVLFGAFLGACRLIGARPAPGRFARRDPGLLWCGAFALTGLVSTVVSLSPVSSVWGLGGYYGGLALVLITAMAYVCVRAYAVVGDLDFVWLGLGATSSVATVLYVLNIFNIDLIGVYENTAVSERAQFFSTLGQKDFNAGFFAIVLPILFYAYLSARTPRRTMAFAAFAFMGSLALAVVDAEALTLGIVVAAMVMVCHKNFDTRMVRRGALIGLAFFLWAAFIHFLRDNMYSQGGRSVLARFGETRFALPGILLCGGVWAVLFIRYRRGKPERPVWPVFRALTVLTLVAVAVLVALVNWWPDFPRIPTLDNLFYFNDDWGTYRGVAWRITWGTWADAPWWRKVLGYGPGSMHQAMVDWADDSLTARMNTFYAAHNEYLEQLITTGALGLAAWEGFVVAHLRRGFAAWYRPGVPGILLALCSYLAQAVVSIRVSMLFPLVMVLFALLWVVSAPAGPAAVAPRKGAGVRYAQVTLCALAAMALAGPLSRVMLWFLF